LISDKKKGVGNMKFKLLAAVSVIATFFAALVASSACFWWMYQPEEPQSLQGR
jgi:cyclic lactone autoinducer peptide